MNRENFKWQEHHDSRVAYYDTFIKAWVQSRLETDKQLITLSVLAIGLLVGVFDKPDSPLEFFIWISACSSFLLCIITKLRVFHINQEYVLLKIQKHDTEGNKAASLGEEEKLNNEIALIGIRLGRLDACSSTAFIAGIGHTAFVVLIDNKQHILSILDILLNLA